MAKSTTKLHKKTEAPKKSVSRKQAPKVAAQKTLKASASSTAKQATKADQILGLLQRPAGATLKALMAATGWQAHSVRGFISSQLVKKMGLAVKSIRRGGERAYEASGLRRGSDRRIL
jgi:hypothetical protein